jgi:hypothetical protein
MYHESLSGRSIGQVLVCIGLALDIPREGASSPERSGAGIHPLCPRTGCLPKRGHDACHVIQRAEVPRQPFRDDSSSVTEAVNDLLGGLAGAAARKLALELHAERSAAAAVDPAVDIHR